MLLSLSSDGERSLLKTTHTVFVFSNKRTLSDLQTGHPVVHTLELYLILILDKLQKKFRTFLVPSSGSLIRFDGLFGFLIFL